MKKTFMLIAIASIVSLSTATLQAAERSFADVYSQCGIGAMLFGNGEGDSSKTLAIISNVTWDLGTTAHSSNASSEDSCKGGAVKTAAFIYHSYPGIESDIAKGNGEFLTAMIGSAQCSIAKDTLLVELRTNLGKQLATSDSSRESNSAVLYDTMSSHCVI